MGRLSLEEMVNPGLLENEVEPAENHEQLGSEAQMQVEESDAEQQDLDRSIDLAESLESIRETLSANSDWTPSEIRLANIATEMAYAGCSSDKARIPALESGDRTLALEGVGERVMGVIKKLGETVSKMWLKMRDILSHIADAFRSCIGQIESIAERLDELETEGKTKFTAKKIKTFASAITADGSLSKDFKEIQLSRNVCIIFLSLRVLR